MNIAEVVEFINSHDDPILTEEIELRLAHSDLLYLCV